MAQRVSADNFDELVLNAGGLVLLDFYSDTCIPCKKQNGPLGDIEDDNEGKLSVYKVNVNYDEALAKKYEVTSVPTIVLFKDGKEADRNTGFTEYEKIDEMISKFI